MIKIAIFSVLALFSIQVSGQNTFWKADSIAKKCISKSYRDIELLAKDLTQNLDTDIEKYRAIYFWVTHSIEYNKRANQHDAEKVLIKKEAVCTGYSNVIDYLCKHSGIESQVVSGFAKTAIGQIGDKYNSNHAWNRVKLSGIWYNSDATWGSAKTIKGKVRKEFDNTYFIMDNPTFCLKHYNKSYCSCSWKKFINAPIYYPSYLDVMDSINLINNRRGKLRTSKLQLRLEVHDVSCLDSFKLDVKTPYFRLLEPTSIEKEQNYHVISFDVKFVSVWTDAVLFYEDKAMLGFKLK